MPSHRTPTVFLLPVLLAGGACAGIATAQQANSTLTNSGQTLGNSNSESVALGDLDGDGDLDAMVANYNQPNTVWTNDGTGTFTNSGQALGNSDSFYVALGDLDGDGDLDAVVANFLGTNTVWTNDGNGTFTNSGQALNVVKNGLCYTVALGDLDGDGDLEIILGGNLITIWTNDGTGSFTFEQKVSISAGSIALGDLDGDGDLDAMFAATGQNTVWTNDGTGILTNSGQRLGLERSDSVALGDLDGDGDLDAMVANYGDVGANGQPNNVWTNDGTGTFCPGSELTCTTNPGQALGNRNSSSVALGDFDGDGKLDAMVANYGQPNIVWSNDGTGNFTNSLQALGLRDSNSVALGDLDGDGDLDAMVANEEANIVWLNTVTGTGVCCAPSGCVVSTENLAGYCEAIGGVYIPNGSCSECIPTCPVDLNGDGVVNGQDLTKLLSEWDSQCASE